VFGSQESGLGRQIITNMTIDNQLFGLFIHSANFTEPDTEDIIMMKTYILNCPYNGYG